MSTSKNKDKLQERILKISNLIGRPAIFYLSVKDRKIEILNVDANFGFEEEDYAIPKKSENQETQNLSCLR